MAAVTRRARSAQHPSSSGKDCALMRAKRPSVLCASTAPTALNLSSHGLTVSCEKPATPHGDERLAPRFGLHNVKELRGVRTPAPSESARAGSICEDRHLGDRRCRNVADRCANVVVSGTHKQKKRRRFPVGAFSTLHAHHPPQRMATLSATEA